MPGGLVPYLLAASLTAAAPVDLVVEGPDPIVLGELEAVDVVVRAPETPEVAGRPLRLSVNVGSFGPVEPVEPGVYRSTYRLPTTRFPQVALVAAWRETGPDAPIAFFRIPLHGRTEVPVRAPAGAMVTVEVGSDRFGPVPVRRGEARVPIVVPPGVEDVRVTSERGSRRSQATVAAGVPPYNRLTLALTPYKVPSDGVSFAVLHAYVDREEPVDPQRVRLRAPQGRFEALGRDGPVHRFRYVPERAEASGTTVDIAGRVLRDPSSRASVTLALGLPVPERLLVRGPDDWVADGEAGARVDVLVTDRLGLGVDGLSLEVTAHPEVVRSVEAEGRGRYRVELDPVDAYPEGGAVSLEVAVSIEDAAPMVEARRIPLAPPPWPVSVQLEPVARLEATGRAQIRWSARDAAGAPYAGGGFDAVIDGAAVPEIRPEGPGRYAAAFDPGPGRRRSEVRLRHDSGRLTLEDVVRIDRPQRRFEIGARAGPLFSGGVLFLGGLELGYRLPALADRIAVRARASFFMREETFDVAFPDGSTGQIDARLAMLPFGLGATVDVLRWRRGGLYAGAFGLVGPGFESVEPRFEGAVERSTRLFGGVEGALGATWRGGFVELSGGFLPVSAADLDAPDHLMAATLGYRLGL